MVIYWGCTSISCSLIGYFFRVGCRIPILEDGRRQPIETDRSTYIYLP